MLHEGLGSAGAVGRFSGQASGRDRRRRVRLFARGLWRFDAGRSCRARSTTCTSRRSRCCRSCSTRSASAAACCSGIPTARRSRRSMPAACRIIACAALALIAPHFIVEDISVTSIAEIKTRLRDHRPQGEARALAQRCRQRVLRLERRLARPGVSRLGYFRIPRLYPRAGCDPAGRRRPVWDDRQVEIARGRVLLSGRCDDLPGRRPFAASRSAGGDARRDLRNSPMPDAARTAGRRPRCA